MTNYEFHPVNTYRCMESNNGDVLDKVISDEEIKRLVILQKFNKDMRKHLLNPFQRFGACQRPEFVWK